MKNDSSMLIANLMELPPFSPEMTYSSSHKIIDLSLWHQDILYNCFSTSTLYDMWHADFGIIPKGSLICKFSKDYFRHPYGLFLIVRHKTIYPLKTKRSYTNKKLYGTFKKLLGEHFA